MHYDKDNKYFLIDSTFWNAWVNYVGWEGRQGYGIKPKDIELDIKPEKGNPKKLPSSLEYQSSFYVIPEK